MCGNSRANVLIKNKSEKPTFALTRNKTDFLEKIKIVIKKCTAD